ncbi:MAG: VCBS repeat-containing protein [Pseudomonadota bacterium]
MILRFAHFVTCILAITVLSVNASAQTTQLPQNLNPLQPEWVVEEITDGSVPLEIVPDERAIAENGLPDGRVTTGTGDIAEAWYSEPTTRYGHAVLGDGVEAGALKVRTNRGEVYTFRLPSTEVFEDIAPRLADLDRDGRTEVITILSSQFEGASVAIFHLNGNAFIKIAQTPFIGTSNRWLNIAEIDNFGGNRRPDIAIVVTPHLAGILQFYRFRNDRLVRIAGAAGFSNHFIGSNELRLSAVADVNNNGIPDLIIPSLARDQLVIVGIRGSQFAELERIEMPARIDSAILVRETDGQQEFVVGLDNGKIYSVSRQ